MAWSGIILDVKTHFASDVETVDFFVQTSIKLVKEFFLITYSLAKFKSMRPKLLQ